MNYEASHTAIFFHPVSKYSPQHSVLKHPTSMLLP